MTGAEEHTLAVSTPSPHTHTPSFTHTHPHIQGHSAEVICASFNTTGSQILTGSFDNTVAVWDTATGK